MVPLAPAVAGQHQVMNAYAFANNETRAVVIEEKNFTPHFFFATVRRLFDNPYLLKGMSKQALAFARPEAGRDIAQYIVRYLTES